MRAESIGCYGNPVVHTPNMDRLAKEGTRFEYCQSFPLCAVARISLVTGWPPHVKGYRSYDHLLGPDEPNMFKYLKQNGYDVYWFGKNDILQHDHFEESVTKWEFFADGPEWDARDNPWPVNDKYHYSFLFGPAKKKPEELPDYKRIQAAIQILEQKHTKPFCLFLPLWYPHPPYTAPEEFYNMYDPEKIPSLRPPDIPGKPEFYYEMRKLRGLDTLNELDFKKINAVYLGMISYEDWLLGKLLQAVDRTGHRNNTVVAVSSDHGDWAGDYGLVEKWSNAMDDAVTRVPLIIRVPGGEKGKVIHSPVMLYDLMATLLDMAGIKIKHTQFAHSLVAQLHNIGDNPEATVYSEGGYDKNEPQCFENLNLPGSHIYYPKVHLQMTDPTSITRTSMIRTSDYKLILRPDGLSEFYDMKKDPREIQNDFNDPQYAEIKDQLRKRLLDWYIRTSDVTPQIEADERPLPAGNYLHR